MLVATGLVHLLKHDAMMTGEGQGETERQLLALMRDYRPDMGLGFVRSTFDILAGVSLTFPVLPVGMGLLGLAVRRHTDRAPGLLRQSATVYAGIFGIMTAIAVRYWFPTPLFFLAAAFACFTAAVAMAPGERGQGRESSSLVLGASFLARARVVERIRNPAPRTVTSGLVVAAACRSRQVLVDRERPAGAVPGARHG